VRPLAAYALEAAAMRLRIDRNALGDD